MKSKSRLSLSKYVKFKMKQLSVKKLALFGHKSYFLGDTIINKNTVKNIVVGDNSCIAANLLCASKGKIIIGNNTWIGHNSLIKSALNVTIGNYCMISDNVIIQDTDCHSLNKNQRRIFLEIPWESKDIDSWYESDAIRSVVIGDDVWIGVNSIILKGVKIGEGSVIGAGSVVTSSIPNNCVAFGNPAKVIKKI